MEVLACNAFCWPQGCALHARCTCSAQRTARSRRGLLRAGHSCRGAWGGRVLLQHGQQVPKLSPQTWAHLRVRRTARPCCAWAESCRLLRASWSLSSESSSSASPTAEPSWRTGPHCHAALCGDRAAVCKGLLELHGACHACSASTALLCQASAAHQVWRSCSLPRQRQASHAVRSACAGHLTLHGAARCVSHACAAVQVQGGPENQSPADAPCGCMDSVSGFRLPETRHGRGLTMSSCTPLPRPSSSESAKSMAPSWPAGHVQSRCLADGACMPAPHGSLVRCPAHRESRLRGGSSGFRCSSCCGFTICSSTHGSSLPQRVVAVPGCGVAHLSCMGGSFLPAGLPRGESLHPGTAQTSATGSSVLPLLPVAAGYMTQSGRSAQPRSACLRVYIVWVSAAACAASRAAAAPVCGCPECQQPYSPPQDDVHPGAASSAAAGAAL